MGKMSIHHCWWKAINISKTPFRHDIKCIWMTKASLVPWLAAAPRVALGAPHPLCRRHARLSSLPRPFAPFTACLASLWVLGDFSSLHFCTLTSSSLNMRCLLSFRVRKHLYYLVRTIFVEYFQYKWPAATYDEINTLFQYKWPAATYDEINTLFLIQTKKLLALFFGAKTIWRYISYS